MFHLKKARMHRRAKKEIIISSSNPFDSKEESSKNTHQQLSHGEDSRIKLLEDDNKVKPSSAHSVVPWSSRSKYKNDFTDSGGLENQSVQDLENYAEYKSEETTKTVNNCLKIAENIRDDATKILVDLHHQGDQITRSHAAAANIDSDLTRGEKLLESLGGLISKRWKRTRTRKISGPAMTRDENRRSVEHLKRHVKPNAKSTYPEPTDVYQKVELEKAKQDDGLSGLSNVLDDLKAMALDIGSELDRQKPALNPFMNEVDDLNIRLKSANQRASHLLRK